MKQKFFLSFMAIAFGVLSASAQAEESLVVNAGNVEHITIANDMDVVLLPAAGGNGLITLDPDASGKLNLRLSNNRLTISSLKPLFKKEKLTVFLYVNNLKTITVENNSQVKTIGVLDTPKLDLFIEGESTVHLRTNGTVKAYPLDDSEIEIINLLENQVAKRGF